MFEVLPGTKGLVIRFERSPERAIEFEPVARDTYMRGLMIARFRRDAVGEVTGFDYSNPVVRHFRFTRLGDRTASAPAAPVAEDPAPAAPAASPFEGLVGEYELARAHHHDHARGQVAPRPADGQPEVPAGARLRRDVHRRAGR